MYSSVPSLGVASWRPFGLGHLLSLVLVVGLALVFPRLARGAAERPVRRGVAVLLLAYLPFKTWLWTAWAGLPVAPNLPFHLCDLAEVLAAVLLWRGGQRVFELVYFFGLAGAVQALLTPDIPYGFPHPTYLAYFFGHGMIVVVAIYGTLGLGLRPTLASIGRAFVALNAYALLVTPINLLLDANFLFLCAKPATSTLLDMMGPWPWYLLALEPLALVLFALCYLPFEVRDRIQGRGRGRRAGAPVGSPEGLGGSC